MKVILVLQARTNSSRLPAKVLLPVNGISLVVLAAMRATNTGLPLVIATSAESSDDALCGVLANWKLPFFRGSLRDVLKRFIDALYDLDDDHVIVRLTGDNVIPDGTFISDMLTEFNRASMAYLSCVGEDTGLPYGLSAEVTRLRYLREAHQKTDSLFDREHVTTWIKRNYGNASFQKYRSIGMGHYRCTVDTFDDYLKILKLFGEGTDVVNVSFLDLTKRLKTLACAPIVNRAKPELVLGTAQLGMNYGITNTTGRPSKEAAERIIKTAISNGVEWIDTARAYGDSENVIGKALDGGWQSRVGIITKLPPLGSCPIGASADVIDTFVERSVYQSCHELKKQSLDVVMLHRASCLTDWNGAVWRRLIFLKNEGIINNLGVSVQNPGELSLAMSFEEAKFIQLPFNILDHRWSESVSRIMHEKQRRDLIIHARSVYLQGLLLSESKKLWKKANCQNYNEIKNWLMIHKKKTEAASISQLCLNYVVSQPWVDGLVVGVETLSQLENNLRLLDDRLLTKDQLQGIEADRPLIYEKTLNPGLWRV